MNAAAPAALAWRVLDVLAILAVLVAAWQGAYDYAGAVAITSPAGTVAFAAALLGSARFWGDVGTTAVALAYSFAIAAALGVFGGLVLGLWRYAADVTEPVLAALYTIPKVTLYREFILSGRGLGYQIAYAYDSFDNRTMYGLMLFVLLVATGMNAALHIWEQRLLRRRMRA